MAGPKGTFFTGPLRNKEQGNVQANLRKWFANLPLALDPDYFCYFNDFVKANDYNTSDWTITTVEGGTGDASEAISTTEVGGALVITNDDADTDSDSLQFTAAAPFNFASGKRHWFESRLKMSSLTSTMMVGLAITDTTPLDASDRVNFRVSSGSSGAILCQADSTADSAVSTSSGESMVADTYAQLGWYWDGIGTVTYFVNRKKVATTSSGIPAASQALQLTLYLANGATAPDAAKAMSIDYVFIAQER